MRGEIGVLDRILVISLATLAFSAMLRMRRREDMNYME